MSSSFNWNNLDKEQFVSIFSKGFISKLKESLEPVPKFNKIEVAEELYSEISNYAYVPKHPRAHIIINKHNHVARICPTFWPKDYFLYFFCCKMLEDDIAINRVDGTWGGWRLGNSIKQKESLEELELFDSAPINSFNPRLWMQNWKAFQKKAYQYSKDDHKYFVKLDIANIYNRINLDILKRRLLATVPRIKQDYVELLFHFLENWNRIVEGYSRKTVGIPQDELSDCSRILANFYLQDFDLLISDFARENDCKYLRYADDQIIYAPSQLAARKVLFEASKMLLKSGLDINSGKVTEFPDRDSFQEYWCFKIFDLLADPDDFEKIRKGVVEMFRLIDSGKVFRRDSVIKRLFSLQLRGLEPWQKHRILGFVLETDFLANIDNWWMSKIYHSLDKNDKIQFVEALKNQIDEVYFNSYHYHLRKFFKRHWIKFNEESLNERIRVLGKL